MYTHTITTKWSNGNLNASGEKPLSAGEERNFDEVCVGSGSNGGVTVFILALTALQVKVIYLKADKALTLSFTTATDPIEIELGAGVPFEWHLGDGFDNPFTSDITGLDVTNAAVLTANLEMHFLIDPTA